MTLSPKVQRRILHDYKKISEDKSNLRSYTVKIDPKQIDHWEITLFGPQETCWEGGIFRMTIDFPNDYPHTQPSVKFVDIPFHPNVYQNGKICIDILQANWSSSYDVSSIMTAIETLLVAPNPNSPANNEAATLYTSNIQEYKRRVKSSFPNK